MPHTWIDGVAAHAVPADDRGLNYADGAFETLYCTDGKIACRDLHQTRLGVALGAKKETFMGLAGMGDLVLTCTDNLSRNRRMGLALGSGKTVEEAQEEIQQVVEGVMAAEAVNEVAEELGITRPGSLAFVNGEGEVTYLHEGRMDDTEAILKHWNEANA